MFPPVQCVVFRLSKTMVIIALQKATNLIYGYIILINVNKSSHDDEVRDEYYLRRIAGQSLPRFQRDWVLKIETVVSSNADAA